LTCRPPGSHLNDGPTLATARTYIEASATGGLATFQRPHYHAGSHPGNIVHPGEPELKSLAGGTKPGHPRLARRVTAVTRCAAGTGRVRVEGLGGPARAPGSHGILGLAFRDGSHSFLGPGILSGSHGNSGRVVALARASREASDLARLRGRPPPGPAIAVARAPCTAPHPRRLARQTAPQHAVCPANSLRLRLRGGPHTHSGPSRLKARNSARAPYLRRLAT
jgi:hypothetical protein